MSQGRGLLRGINVLDLSSVGPAARCTRLLADYGAEVVKVCPVAGRGAQQIVPSYYAYSAGRHMRRVQIDLSEERGRRAFVALAVKADVVVESFRPGVAERLGIGYEALREQNARLIYVSTSGYGQIGPHSTWAGHDLDYLAKGGYLASCEPGDSGKPPVPGATIADAAAGGMQAALAICAALLGRQGSGHGTYLDVSVTDGVLWLMSLQIDEHLATGKSVGWGHDVLSGRYACYDNYRAKDGKWLSVGAIEAKFFASLCSALGCEHLIDHQYDDVAQDQIRAELQAVFATKERDQWVSLLAPADTCVAPVLSIDELADDSQLRSRAAFAEVKHPTKGTFRQLAPVLAGMDPQPEPLALRDASSTDTAELLLAAGMTREEIDGLMAEGLVA